MSVNNALGIGSAIISAGSTIYGMIRNRKAAKEQQQRQKELQEHAREQQMKTWEDTNYSAQRKQLEKAGLNAGLLYGMGGQAGGQTGSVGAGNAGQEQVYDVANALNNAKMTAAQIELAKSQTEKNKAEAEKISGADTKKVETDTRLAEINAQVQERLGADRIAKSAEWEMDRMDSSNVQQIREFEAWLAEAYQFGDGDEFEVDKYGVYSKSPNDLIRKVKRAGLDEVIQRVESLKKQLTLQDDEHDLNEIDKEIRDFRADLSKLGLSEQTAPLINIILKAILRQK